MAGVIAMMAKRRYEAVVAAQKEREQERRLRKKARKSSKLNLFDTVPPESSENTKVWHWNWDGINTTVMFDKKNSEIWYNGEILKHEICPPENVNERSYLKFKLKRIVPFPESTNGNQSNETAPTKIQTTFNENDSVSTSESKPSDLGTSNEGPLNESNGEGQLNDLKLSHDLEHPSEGQLNGLESRLEGKFQVLEIPQNGCEQNDLEASIAGQPNELVSPSDELKIKDTEMINESQLHEKESPRKVQIKDAEMIDESQLHQQESQRKEQVKDSEMTDEGQTVDSETLHEGIIRQIVIHDTSTSVTDKDEIEVVHELFVDNVMIQEHSKLPVNYDEIKPDRLKKND